jgi:hypothetical protein
VTKPTTNHQPGDLAMFLTVVPAMGRDYTSDEAVKADWESGKDFTINDMSSKYDGSYINKEDADNAGITVNVRYNKLRNVCVINNKKVA